MSPMARTLLAGILLALLTAPILAQRQETKGKRPSRECIREIAQLCGTEPQGVRACLAEQSQALSDKCQKQVRKRMGVSEADRLKPRPFVRAIRPTRSVLFGDHQRQRVDIYEPEGAVEALPLVLFIHGGGWRIGSHERVQAKSAHFPEQDIYFASTGYRLLPDYPVEDQAKDVGLALQALVSQAGIIGFDAKRVVLMGHSAGAHLAALVATDPQYASEAFGAIKGVVLLDGAGYDVAQNMEDAEFQARRVYEDAFGFDEERKKALSPVTHVGGADAPNWLALYVEDRAIAKKQADLLVARLTSAGQSASAVAIANTDHGQMNRDIGTEAGKAQTEAIDAFLTNLFD